MRKSRFTEAQIVAALRHAGSAVREATPPHPHVKTPH